MAGTLPQDRAMQILSAYVLSQTDSGRNLADIAEGRELLLEASRAGELADVAEWICAEFAGLWTAYAETHRQEPADMWRRYRLADAAGADDG